MLIRGFLANSNYFRRTFVAILLLIPLLAHASFIESTMGTAVVNDATASYYNPAALTLLTKPQVIAQGSMAYFQSQFTGQVTQSTTGFSQSGTSNASTQYFLPTFYMGIPAPHSVTTGLAVIVNDFDNDIEEHSILRYVQSNNQIQDLDVVPAIGVKVNEYVSVGAGLTLSHATFHAEPIIGFPSLNIPDSQSRNDSSANSWGLDAGILLKPTPSTQVGFNYRGAITYHLQGTSTFNGVNPVTSNNYQTAYWTPARSVLSINQFVTPKLGFIGTVQYVQWNVFKDITVNNVATAIGARSVVLPSAILHYHFHNTWQTTVGAHYRVSPKWVVRVAASYVPSPGNDNYQIVNGNSLTIGASMGYQVFKNVQVDCGYAHSFLQNADIHIATAQSTINGVNTGRLDAVSLKLTFTV